MAGRVLVVAAALLVAGAVGVVAVPHCKDSAYLPHAPIPQDNEVWLYVFKYGLCERHSGIGTRGSYWFYGKDGLIEYSDYSHDRCNGPLMSWIKLGHTSKTKVQIYKIIENLKNRCYPGYHACWKFIPTHWRLTEWNTNHFTHHLSAALGVLEGFPAWLWTGIPGFHCGGGSV